jgi:hypothetical protein
MANEFMKARMKYDGKLVAASNVDGWQVLLNGVWTPVESVLAPRWDQKLVSRRLLLWLRPGSWAKEQMARICKAYEERGLTSETKDPFKRAEELEEAWALMSAEAQAAALAKAEAQAEAEAEAQAEAEAEAQAEAQAAAMAKEAAFLQEKWGKDGKDNAQLRAQKAHLTIALGNSVERTRREDNVKLQAEKAAQKDENARLQRMTVHLRKTMASLTRSNVKLVCKLRGEKDKLQKEKAALEASIGWRVFGTKLQKGKETAELKAEIAKLREENAKLREENAKLQAEKKKPREEKEKLREENAKLSGDGPVLVADSEPAKKRKAEPAKKAKKAKKAKATDVANI